MKFADKDWSASKFFGVVLLVCALAAFAANLTTDYLVGGEHSQERVPCWPDFPCGFQGGPGPLAYNILQEIRVQAWNDLNGSPSTINRATFNEVAEALVHCASDIKAFDKGGQTGNTAHCNWLKQIWTNAVAAQDDMQWLAVAAELETGH